MIFFNYRLAQKNKQIKYGVSSLFRYTYMVILAVVVVAFVLTGSLPIVGVIIALISLVALTYREEWVFDDERAEARYQISFLLLNKSNAIPFDDIHYFDLQSRDMPQPFSRKRIQYYLVLINKEGETYEVGSDKVRYSDKILEDANTIALYCDKPLHHTQI